HACGLVPDLDCLPALDVPDCPSRFEHNPRVCMPRVGQAALRYLHAVNEYENVTVFIPMNLANRCFVTHGSRTRILWLLRHLEFDGADTRRSVQRQRRSCRNPPRPPPVRSAPPPP